MTWQPIETAPKDGSVILLWGGKPDYYSDELSSVHSHGLDQSHWDKIRPVTGWWYGEGWQYCSYDSGTYGEFENPTHWTPLPKAPE